MKVSSIAVAFLVVLAGCGTPESVVTPEMTSAPTGSWVSSNNSETTLEIDAGGTFKLVRAGQENIGIWKPDGPNAMKITINGAESQTTFTRKDMMLSLTLPGDPNPTAFGQM
jgi:uncharacterized protein YjdB